MTPRDTPRLSLPHVLSLALPSPSCEVCRAPAHVAWTGRWWREHMLEESASRRQAHFSGYPTVVFAASPRLGCEHRYRQPVTLRIPRGYSYGYIDSHTMQSTNLRMRKGHMETARWSGTTEDIAPIDHSTPACRLLRAALLAVAQKLLQTLANRARRQRASHRSRVPRPPCRPYIMLVASDVQPGMRGILP